MEQVLYVLLVCFCVLGTFYQCIEILDLYFRYPYTVSISVVGKQAFNFPGITLCTSGFMSRQVMQEACKKSQSGISASHRKMSDCFADFIAAEPLERILNQSISMYEFIEDVRCAVDEINSSISCRTHLHEGAVKTFQGDTVCWTLFHKTSYNFSPLANVKIQTGYKQSAMLIADEGVSMSLFNQSVQPREIIRFLLNFTSMESMMSDEPVFGRVAVHESSRVAHAKKTGTKVHSGRFYEVSYEEHITISLPPPYDTNCVDYDDINWTDYQKEGRRKLNPFTTPLSSPDCFTGCMGVNTLQHNDCLCWPPEIPFMRDDDDFGPIIDGQSFLCNWISFAKSSSQVLPKLNDSMSSSTSKSKAIMNAALEYFRNCSASFEHECKQSCRKACESSRMKTIISESAWPSDQEILATELGSPERMHLQHFRDCCTIISIKYASNEVTVYTTQAKYEVIEFISYIGGIIGLWLGFTFVGMIDYAKSGIHAVRSMMSEYKSMTAKIGVRKRSSITIPEAALSRRRPTVERLPWYYESAIPEEVIDGTAHDQYRRNSTVKSILPEVPGSPVRGLDRIVFRKHSLAMNSPFFNHEIAAVQ